MTRVWGGIGLRFPGTPYPFSILHSQSSIRTGAGGESAARAPGRQGWLLGRGVARGGLGAARAGAGALPGGRGDRRGGAGGGERGGGRVPRGRGGAARAGVGGAGGRAGRGGQLGG